MGDAFARLDRWLLRILRKCAGHAPIRFGLRGLIEEGSEGPPVATVRIADRRTLAALVLDPESNFGDAYSNGRIEVEGDLVRLLEVLYESLTRAKTRRGRLAAQGLGWIQSNTLPRSRRNIHHHYDLPTDFYRLWLDPQLIYTCAYFPDGTASLEEAQRAKLDLVCRKLWLRPGETVVEAGCGWGALALHMAKCYGVRVRAFNISREQIVFARERARQEGLTGSVEFVEDDYRNIVGRSDVFIAVGMLEHVGREHYLELSRVIHRVIGESGRGLLHFIGRNCQRPLNAWIRRRIFPGAYPPTLGEAMRVLEPHNFSLTDVENLRLHYAATLEHWLSRFERSYDAISSSFGSHFARMWRLYLAGSVAAFRVGTLQLFQLVFAGRECSSIPWTRAYLYEDAVETKDQDQACAPAMS